MTDFATVALYTIMSCIITSYAGWKLIPNTVRYYGISWFDWTNDQTVPRNQCIIIAAITTAFLIFVAWRSNPHLLPGLALVFSALAGTFVVDRYFQVIPDRFHIMGLAGTAWIILAMALQGYPLTLSDRLLFGPGLAGVLWLCAWAYEKIRKVTAMGLGDIKLFAWLGLLAGSDLPAILLVSMSLALLWNLPGIWTKKLGRTEAFAFGPFIAIAACGFLLL